MIDGIDYATNVHKFLLVFGSSAVSRSPARRGMGNVVRRGCVKMVGGEIGMYSVDLVRTNCRNRSAHKKR